MKKLINGCHFININHTEKFQITDPSTKFGSLVFRVSTDMEYHWKIGDANFLFSEFSIGLFFPVTHPRFHFNIYAWLHLEHLCVEHLCISGLPHESPMCSFTLPDILFRNFTTF